MDSPEGWAQVGIGEERRRHWNGTPSPKRDQEMQAIEPGDCGIQNSVEIRVSTMTHRARSQRGGE